MQACPPRLCLGHQKHATPACLCTIAVWLEEAMQRIRMGISIAQATSGTHAHGPSGCTRKLTPHHNVTIAGVYRTCRRLLTALCPRARARVACTEVACVMLLTHNWPQYGTRVCISRCQGRVVTARARAHPSAGPGHLATLRTETKTSKQARKLPRMMQHLDNMANA